MALQSACDMVLPLEVFLDEALDVSLRPPSAPQPASAPQKAAAGPEADSPSPRAPEPPSEILSVRNEKDMERLRQLMQEQLLSIVAAAQAPSRWPQQPSESGSGSATWSLSRAGVATVGSEIRRHCNQRHAAGNPGPIRLGTS